MDKYESSKWGTVDRYTESLDLNLGGGHHWLEPWAVNLLREFFRAEEDERLGRWRWNDYVVYHHGDWLTLIHEPDGTHDRISVAWARAAVTDDPSRANVQYAAIAWAQAHKEPKYTVTEWVAKAMYEGQAGVPWEEARDEDRDFWVGSAAAAIAKYEEIR